MTADTRNTERTRRAVLDAAARLFAERGSGVALADVAAAAGVSKGGLLHHFPARDQLIAAMADDALDGFRASVLQHLDLSENAPGKMVRAYVRTLCGGDEEAMRSFISSPLWSGLQVDPVVAERLTADATRWQADLAADGLDPDRIGLVTRAAEGYAAGFVFGEESSAALARACRILVALTLDATPLPGS